MPVTYISAFVFGNFRETIIKIKFAFSDINSTFDLEIAEMLGSCDPWYRSVVTYTTNNLLRIRPTVRFLLKYCP